MNSFLRRTRTWLGESSSMIGIVLLAAVASLLTALLHDILPSNPLGAVASALPLLVVLNVWTLIQRIELLERKLHLTTTDIADALIKDHAALADAHNKLTTMVYDLAAIVREMEKQP